MGPHVVHMPSFSMLGRRPDSRTKPQNPYLLECTLSWFNAARKNRVILAKMLRGPDTCLQTFEVWSEWDVPVAPPTKVPDERTPDILIKTSGSVRTLRISVSLG